MPCSEAPAASEAVTLQSTLPSSSTFRGPMIWSTSAFMAFAMGHEFAAEGPRFDPGTAGNLARDGISKRPRSRGAHRAHGRAPSADHPPSAPRARSPAPTRGGCRPAPRTIGQNTFVNQDQQTLVPGPSKLHRASAVGQQLVHASWGVHPGSVLTCQVSWLFLSAEGNSTTAPPWSAPGRRSVLHIENIHMSSIRQSDRLGSLPDSAGSQLPRVKAGLKKRAWRAQLKPPGVSWCSGGFSLAVVITL